MKKLIKLQCKSDFTDELNEKGDMPEISLMYQDGLRESFI